MAQKRLWHTIFILFLLAFILYESNKVNQPFKSNEKYEEDYNRTMLWLKENSDESSIILADWFYGPNIATFAGRGVITTTKVYPSEIKFMAERYRDASRFFFAIREDNAMSIIKKYNITHIFVQKKGFQYSMCAYIKICSSDKQYRTPSGQLLQDIRSKLLVTRMQDGKDFYNFKKIYDSNFFVIYQVVKPEGIKNDGIDQYATGMIKNAVSTSSKTEKYLNVFGMIVPHHLTYASQITADAFKSIKGRYDTIIILGPDHFSSSKYGASTSGLEWETPFGKLMPDREIIKRLDLKFDEAAHIHEHSVRMMLPFIKHKFPDAKIVPIILNESLQEQEAISLGERIGKLDNTLIIASLDFSHDYDLGKALEQDARSIKIIQGFKKDEVYSLNVDSRPSLLALLTAMEHKNAKRTELLNYTNSGQLTKDYPKNVGYISMIFQK